MEKLWHIITNNIGTKLISVVVAIFLWAIVLGSRNVEVTKEIPVEVITASDIVAANEIPDRIGFRLSGPKAFLRAVLDRREEPIRVNLSNSKPGLVTYRFFSDNIRLPIGVKVLSINPTAILVKLEYIKKREVPVRAEIRGAPPDGYHVTKVTTNPDVIRIKGAESRVDSISDLSTLPIDVSSQKATFEKEASFDLGRYNIQLDSPAPHVTVEIAAGSANFRIKNVDIRVISPFKARLDEKTVTVLVRAEQKSLNALDRTRVFAVVDLTGKPKGKYSTPVKVTVPNEIGLVKIIPDKVNVTLY